VTRIAIYPWLHKFNQYQPLFYRALEHYGYTLSLELKLDNGFLEARGAEFDVMHIHWSHEQLWRCRRPGLVGRAHGLVGMWRYFRLARRLGKTIVWTVHDLDHLEQALWVDRLGNALLGWMADVVICHTPATRDRLVNAYKTDRRKVVVMPIGNYDGVYPAPRPRTETLGRYGLDPARRTLVAVGLVRDYKGFDVAVEAVRRLGPTYQIVWAGGLHTPSHAVADDLRARAAGMENVRVDVRTIDDAEMADLYGAADCVLLPYRRITGSAALLTALTLGRGVVASDLTYFREVLADEPAAGVFCQPDDVAGLAGAVETFFLGDVTARHAAARRLADRYAWPEVIKPVAERMNAVLAGRRSVPAARTGPPVQSISGTRP
jgi:glycosyltransferase involved in cell wall biosynthesis